MTTIWEPSDFGAVGDCTTDGTDDTVALQAFFNASKNGRGRIPAKRYKITAPIVIDPHGTYRIEGDGYDQGGDFGSTIYNLGSGDALQLQDPNNIATNFEHSFSHFCIKGNRYSGHGLRMFNIHKFFGDRLWFLAHGDCGIYAEECFSSAFDNIVASHSNNHGLRLHNKSNAVRVSGGAYIDNDRNCNDASNIGITAVPGKENNVVLLIGVDFSSPSELPWGTPVASCGLGVSHTRSLHLINCYAEGVAPTRPIPYHIYTDSTVSGLKIESSYFQDGKVFIAGTNGFFICNTNVFIAQNVATSLVASATDGKSIVRAPVLINGATMSLSGVLTA